MKLHYEGREFDLEPLGGDDLLTHRLAELGTFYELDLLEYMLAMRRWMHGDTAVDVGGNIGNHALFFANYLFDRVVSVEPHERLYGLLVANLRDTGVECVQMALGAAKGTGHIIPGRKQNLGEARAVFGGDGDIQFTTLDALSQGRNVGMVKIDVEGGEMEVLRGATRVLSEDRPHLFIECSTRAVRDGFTAYLKPFGYRRLSRWAVTPVYHFAYDPPLRMIAESHWRRPVYRLHRFLKRQFKT